MFCKIFFSNKFGFIMKTVPRTPNVNIPNQDWRNNPECNNPPKKEIVKKGDFWGILLS